MQAEAEAEAERQKQQPGAEEWKQRAQAAAAKAAAAKAAAGARNACRMAEEAPSKSALKDPRYSAAQQAHGDYSLAPVTRLSELKHRAQHLGCFSPTTSKTRVSRTLHGQLFPATANQAERQLQSELPFPQTHSARMSS